MFISARKYDSSLSVLRYEERPWGFLVHALGVVPIWGFIFMSCVWLYYRHRSREMVFHVQQAVQFHIFILLPVLGWVMSGIIASIVYQLSPMLAGLLETVALFLILTFLALMAAVALFGGVLTYMGRPFLYPVIGARVLSGTLAKLKEE